MRLRVYVQIIVLHVTDDLWIEITYIEVRRYLLFPLRLCDPYLVVIGAVRAEIRLRTKHLVHHIQAAHGGDHGAEPSLMQRAGVFRRRGDINPGGGGHWTAERARAAAGSF